jgi:hypothetical protein
VACRPCPRRAAAGRDPSRARRRAAGPPLPDAGAGSRGLWLDFLQKTPVGIHGVIFKGQPPAVEVITDPITVVAAKQDAVAGYMVVPTLLVLSAAEVGPDVLTDLAQVKGRKAAVDIPAGTPITPDLLEPPPDE